jgi:hypothetical protein
MYAVNPKIRSSLRVFPRKSKGKSKRKRDYFKIPLSLSSRIFVDEYACVISCCLLRTKLCFVFYKNGNKNKKLVFPRTFLYFSRIWAVGTNMIILDPFCTIALRVSMFITNRGKQTQCFSILLDFFFDFNFVIEERPGYDGL